MSAWGAVAVCCQALLTTHVYSTFTAKIKDNESCGLKYLKIHFVHILQKSRMNVIISTNANNLHKKNF